MLPLSLWIFRLWSFNHRGADPCARLFPGDATGAAIILPEEVRPTLSPQSRFGRGLMEQPCVRSAENQKVLPPEAAGSAADHMGAAAGG